MKLALVWAATTINMVAVSTFQTPIEILKSQHTIGHYHIGTFDIHTFPTAMQEEAYEMQCARGYGQDDELPPEGDNVGQRSLFVDDGYLLPHVHDVRDEHLAKDRT